MEEEAGGDNRDNISDDDGVQLTRRTIRARDDGRRREVEGLKIQEEIFMQTTGW